jgi:hypothetical protein
MGNELVDVLRARLDETEAAAKSASPGPWWLVQNHVEGGDVVQRAAPAVAVGTPLG